MKKLLCIIAAAMALIVASSTAMAEPKKRSVSDKATHRMKSPRSVPAAVCTENLNPNVRVMKSAKDRIWRDRSDPLNRAKGGRIFIQ